MITVLDKPASQVCIAASSLGVNELHELMSAAPCEDEAAGSVHGVHHQVCTAHCHRIALLRSVLPIAFSLCPLGTGDCYSCVFIAQRMFTGCCPFGHGTQQWL